MRKIKKSWFIIAGVVIILAVFFGTKAFIERPQNLGSELLYVGQETSGCYFHWFCSSDPITTYYFATDLSQNDLEKFFKNASYITPEVKEGGSSGQYSYDYLYFQSEQGKKFLVEYYDNTQAVLDIYNLKQTGKQHVVSLTVENFLVAKSSL